MHLDLVDDSGGQILVDDLSAAADEDVLSVGRLPRLLERRLDAIGDEREGGVGEGQRLPLVVGDDEDRLVEGRVLAPPARPRIVAPGTATGRTELPAPHDLGADVRVFLVDNRAADVLLAALLAVRLAPRLELDDPVVELFAPLAERVLLALVGPGDVAVRRYRDVDSHLAHVSIDGPVV